VAAFGPNYFDPERQQERRARMQEMRDAVAKTGQEMADVSALFFNEPRTDVADWLSDHGWDVSTNTSTELMTRHKRDMAGDVPDTGSVFVEGRRLTG
jgi:O-methyltransferase involved in polyketide biosynthesis